MMGGQIFIALLNPGIGLLLAAAFLLLWLNRRDQTYVAIAAASYALSAVGFVIQDIGPALPHQFHRVLSNLCFILSGCTLAAAVLLRYRIPVPYRPMVLIAVAAMAGHIWFLLVVPSLAGRIYAISFSLGMIALLTVVKLYSAPKPHLIDRLLICTAALAAANFIIRPLLIAWLVGGYTSDEGFQQSVYWTTVQFTQAMISITVALNLMVAVAIGLINELRQEANTDKLSGLLNRRGFEEEASAALRTQAARGWPVALLIADIDNFKSINDTYGHAVGDSVIAMLGELVARMSGTDTVAGRIGGEEFAILMAGAELGAARGYAERLRAELPGYGDGQLPPGLKPTISVGLHADHALASLYDLLSRADIALYEAKRSGRNCTTVFKAGLTLVNEGIA
jgi:diguanylate cyclase (GGDEF)-like protein